MAEQVTKAMLERKVESIRKLGADVGLDWAYGQARVSNRDTSSSISPRGSRGLVWDFLTEESLNGACRLRFSCFDNLQIVEKQFNELSRDGELIYWLTRGDFRRFLKADLGRPPTDKELDEVIRRYTKCDLSEATECISNIIEFYHDDLDHDPDFLKRKGD